ncbi:hypothetical protein [Nocardioides pakistanensis]
MTIHQSRTPIRIGDTIMDAASAFAEADLRYGDREISDAAAASIAAVFAAVHRPALSALATGASTFAEEVLDDVADARRSTRRDSDRRALDMLGTWTIAASRTGRRG